jgi:beta-lysine 5,6-aminomutase beta subunit
VNLDEKSPVNGVRAYGDRDADGMVQMSFVLPVAPSARSRAAAMRFAEMHGLREPLVAAMEPCAHGYSFFVVYGSSVHTVDPSTLNVTELESATLSREEIERRVRTDLDRKVVIVGACTGSDAHTVGIDAILNYKGYAGDKGLESYRGFEVHNLGAQVDNTQLAEKAKSLRAHAVLVSQVITQRNCHKENARAFAQIVETAGWRAEVLLLLGGPRVDHALAIELGFDAGFGPGTKPGDVASYIVQALVGRPRGG